jgi:hypothetical protein
MQIGMPVRALNPGFWRGSTVQRCLRRSTSAAQMPKLGEMAQLSRPFQIALVAVVLLAGVWLFALQGHSSSTGSTSSAPVVSASAPAASKPASSGLAHSGSASTAAAEAKGAAKPTHIYHGSAPGVEGLTRAIAKAHGAVATSQQNAKRLEAKSAQASGESTSGGVSSATAPAQHSSSPSTTASPPSTVGARPIKAQAGAGRTPARQASVERALDEGKVAVILFWNPKGADDVAVDNELRLLEAVHHLIRPLARTPQLRRSLKASGLELEKRFAAFASPSSQVASYGSITRGVQVYGTPTILIVNKRGETTVLTGVQDAFSIEQAIDEVRNS